MVRFGSASTRPRVAFVLGATIALAGCGASKPGTEDADSKQDSEMTKESGFGGDGSEGPEDVEPADHDIEVPPAP